MGSMHGSPTVITFIAEPRRTEGLGQQNSSKILHKRRLRRLFQLSEPSFSPSCAALTFVVLSSRCGLVVKQRCSQRVHIKKVKKNNNKSPVVTSGLCYCSFNDLTWFNYIGNPAPESVWKLQAEQVWCNDLSKKR